MYTAQRGFCTLDTPVANAHVRSIGLHTAFLGIYVLFHTHRLYQKVAELYIIPLHKSRKHSFTFVHNQCSNLTTVQVGTIRILYYLVITSQYGHLY